MAKHTIKEILSIFAAHVGHTHEAAVQATYDAGHARAREEFAAGLAAPVAALQPDAPPEGEKADVKEDAPAGQPSKENKTAKAAADKVPAA